MSTYSVNKIGHYTKRGLEKTIDYIEYLYLKSLIKAKDFNYQTSILICSESRSGSTWLMQMLNKNRETVINWEPLHKNRGVLPAKYYQLGDRIYIPPEQQDLEFEVFFKEMLEFKRSSQWSMKFCTREDIKNSTRVITKCIRAHMLLPWITRYFEFQSRPIYLLRHPIPVALSQISHFQDENSKMGDYQVPDWANNERFLLHQEYLKSLTSKLQREVAHWCLNNVPLINTPKNERKWKVVFYENLVLNPEKELIGICDELKLKIDPENISFRAPSKTTDISRFMTSPEKQLTKWQQLSKSELKSIQNIFDYFGLKIYSINDPYPKTYNA